MYPALYSYVLTYDVFRLSGGPKCVCPQHCQAVLYVYVIGTVRRSYVYVLSTVRWSYMSTREKNPHELIISMK